MRILHVIDSLDVGGAEKILIALANGFCAQHTVAVCCVSHLGSLASELDPKVELFCMDRGPGNDYLLPWRLARRIRHERYAIVHSHNWSVFLESGMAAWLARAPFVVHTAHGPRADATGGWARPVKRALRRWLEHRVASRFDVIVAVSDAIRDYIPEVVGIHDGRLLTVRNGIADGGRSVDTVDAKRLSFIAVGRFDPIKNHDMMLRAFAVVASQYRNASLVIVGDGPCRARIEALIGELGLQPRVVLTGFSDDVAGLLSQADVFLLSSRYEGISIALLEAMRAGLPAVVTQVGGIPETVVGGRTGLIVASEDAAAFAEAMLSFAGSASMRRSYGVEARALQAREFSLDAMLDRYSEIYAQVDRKF